MKNIWESMKRPQFYKAVCWAVGLGVLAYFIFLSNFLLDDHYPRIPWVDPYYGLNRGNWLSPLVHFFNSNANIPVINPFFAICFLAVGGGLFATEIVGISSFASILTGAVLAVVFPIQVVIFYYSFSSFAMALGQLVSILAIAVVSTTRWRDMFIGAVLVFASMSINQVSASVVVTVFLCYCISEFVFNRVDFSAFFQWFCRRLLPKCVAICTGFAGYWLSTFFTAETYVTKTVGLEGLAGKIVHVVKASFKHLVLTQPEFLSLTKYLILGSLLLASIIMFVLAKGIVAKAAVCILAMLLPVATKFMYFISASVAYYIYRYNLSFVYMHVFAFVMIVFFATSVTRRRYIQIGLLVLVCFLGLRFVQANLIRQHVLLRGQQHDLALSNRILTRIGSLEGLDPTKKYYLLRVGSYPEFRKKIFQTRGHTYDMPGGQHMDICVVTGWWNPESVMFLLGSHVKFKPVFGARAKLLEKLKSSGALEGRKKWPHKSSVFISDDMIVVNLE